MKYSLKRDNPRLHVKAATWTHEFFVMLLDGLHNVDCGSGKSRDWFLVRLDRCRKVYLKKKLEHFWDQFNFGDIDEDERKKMWRRVQQCQHMIAWREERDMQVFPRQASGIPWMRID
jgi:hypothetical protein